MTGGRVVILGRTGRNFAAGMSGGIAYVWDRDGQFNLRCNLATVELEKITSPEEEAEIREMIQHHFNYTGSEVAREVLENWQTYVQQCVKVMPTDYKRVLQQLAEGKPIEATADT